MKPGEQWIIEHIHHAPSQADRHDAIIRLLTAPVWGRLGGASTERMTCGCSPIFAV